MPKGDLVVEIARLSGAPAGDRVELDFERFSGDLGAGGDSMHVGFKTGQETSFRITGLPCRGGPGTVYRVVATLPHHRTYSFFQSIQEDQPNPASDDIEFWVKPGDVKDIRGPEFSDLPGRVRAILSDAQMRSHEHEDSDLAGETGSALYDKLGPLRKACLLNIVKKASHSTSDRCLSAIEALLICRQDRFFAFVESDMADALQQSALYKTAKDSLHKPLAGFEMIGRSFKTRDAHANLQVTFMREVASGRIAADIDVDESSGIEHGFEVIRNAMFRNRTNPYLIHEFLLSADPQEHSLDPGYEFVFGS
jgi:hypothetical protein